MLKKGMYVRCPVDNEFPAAPRDFAAGRIDHIDNFNETADISFLDPFGYSIFYELAQSKIKDVPLRLLTHNHIPDNYMVLVNNQKMTIQTSQKDQEGYFHYYLKNSKTNCFEKHDEREIIAPFTACGGDPVTQLKNYEFQNPCWFLGRHVVEKTMSALNNSIYGFKELAGCRIYLKAYQIDTIMRCLSFDPCRYMIADEVGLGKTIEACSILKIYLSNHNNQNVLIITPHGLLEQWRTELFFKFNLAEGTDENKNTIKLIGDNDLSAMTIMFKWNFLIIDEVHNYLNNNDTYRYMHALSHSAKNVLLLSATPIQQRQEEYLKLLRLLLPEKYDEMTEGEFNNRLNIQKKILRTANSIINGISSYAEDIEDFKNNGESLENNEDLKGEAEDILNDFYDIARIVNDSHLNEMIDAISTDTEDLGVSQMQLTISYICENYQIENHMIRGRRTLHKEEFAERKKELLSYSIDENNNFYESEAYRALTDWIHSNDLDHDCFNEWIQPILMSFFSSPWAYQKMLQDASKQIKDIPMEVLISSKRWVSDENNQLKRIEELLEEPDLHPDRLIQILNYVMNTVPIGKKVVLFTDFKETFDQYDSIFSKELGDEYTAYGGSISQEQREINISRFQSDSKCHYLLCDKSGGEGRNLQIADYVVHIDLPWDISELEQRIGRLDRLGRDVHIPVISVVTYSVDTYEEQLFKLWDTGMKVFDESLSGLEIMMGEITAKISQVLNDNPDYGLQLLVPELISEAEKTRKEVKVEQIYDVAAKQYQPMYNRINAMIEKYKFNENSIFSQTMMSWAALAGFKAIPSSKNPNLIRFNSSSFSVNSAKRAFLIPPNWKGYIKKKQNVHAIKLQTEIEKSDQGRNQINQNNSILGTFDRNYAIKEDYLHFFAPGDDVFDSIVNNAEQSYKGTCCALAAVSEINWAGFIYVMSVKPDEKYLLDNNVSLFAMSQFRMYLGTNMMTIPVGFADYKNVSNKDVIHELNRISRNAFDDKEYIDHIGRRGMRNGFLEIPAKHLCSNFEYFEKKYPYEEWTKLVDQSKLIAQKRALSKLEKLKDMVGVRELMDQKLSSQLAMAELFGEQIDVDDVKRQFEAIYTSINKPEVEIAAACFMRLSKIKHD